jgi:shikimate kinase
MARMFSKKWSEEVAASIVADEVAERERALRELHVIQGVCHRHPHVRISTGGGFPMYDGLCGECEQAMES